MNVNDLTEEHHGKRIRLVASMKPLLRPEGTFEGVQLVDGEQRELWQRGTQDGMRSKHRVWIDGNHYDVERGAPVEILD